MINPKVYLYQVFNYMLASFCLSPVFLSSLYSLVISGVLSSVYAFSISHVTHVVYKKLTYKKVVVLDCSNRYVQYLVIESSESR